MVGGKMGFNKRVLLLGLLLVFMQASGAMANTLEEISYSILSGGRIQIVLNHDQRAGGERGQLCHRQPGAYRHRPAEHAQCVEGQDQEHCFRHCP